MPAGHHLDRGSRIARWVRRRICTRSTAADLHHHHYCLRRKPNTNHHRAAHGRVRETNMKSQLKLAISLFIVTAAALLAPAGAQTSPVVERSGAQPDLALTYSYIRSNAPPAQCGCFSLNGGSATFAWPIKASAFAVAGDIT